MPDYLLALLLKFVHALLGFFGLLIVSRHFGPGGKGIVTEALLPATTLLMFFKLGVDYASVMVLRRYKERQDYLLGSFVTSITLLVVFILFLLSPVCEDLWHQLIIFFPPDYMHYARLALWLFPAQLFHDACLNAILGSYNFRAFTWVKVIQPVVFSGILASFWAYTKWVEIGSFELTDVLMAYIISYSVSAFLMFCLLLRKLPFRLQGSLNCIRFLVKVGGVVQLIALLIYLNRRIDVWMISWVLDSEDNGIYAVVVSFLEVAWFASKPLSSLVLIRSASDDGLRGAGRILRFSLGFSGLYLVALYFSAPWLLSLAGPTFVEPGLQPLFILLPGILLMNIHQILSQIFYGLGEGAKLVSLMFVALIINFSLNHLWIQDHGLIGVALSSTISYSLISFGVLFLVTRRLKVSWKDLLIPRRGDLKHLIQTLKANGN